MERVAYVKARFTPGSFPTEYTFRVDTPPGSFDGAAPSHYCLTPDRQRLTGVPATGVEGRLVGLVVGSPPSPGRVRVYLPDGELYEFAEDQVEYPAGRHNRVPIGA